MNGMEFHICDNCAAFGAQKIDDEQDDGACRMNPPTLIPLGEDGFISVFPPVNREDWCMAWTAKDE